MAIAADAAQAIMAIYARAELASITKANDAGPLTEADLAANRVICSGLVMIAPEIAILSEESPWQGGHAQRYWAVDPLDGTKEFLKRNGEFTVNIALVENGRPTLGVVLAPATGEAWVGVTPACSLLLAHEELAQSVALKRQAPGAPWQAIAAAVHLDPNEAFNVVASRSHPSPQLEQWLGRIALNVKFLEKGSSLKLCLVAQGAAHVYPRFGPTSIWDTAAGHAVALASGAAVLVLRDDGGLAGELSYLDATQTLNPFFIVASPAALSLEALMF